MVPHSLATMEWHVAVIGIVNLMILFTWPNLRSAAVKRIPPALVVWSLRWRWDFIFTFLTPNNTATLNHWSIRVNLS